MAIPSLIKKNMTEILKKKIVTTKPSEKNYSGQMGYD